MHRRYAALFTGFTVVAVIAVLLISAYQGWIGARVQAYVWQISKCAFLGEASCNAHPRCQAYYEADPQYPDELQFQACRAKTGDQLAAETEGERRCQQTKGTWQATPYGPYCQCPTGLTYAVGVGCQP